MYMYVSVTTVTTVELEVTYANDLYSVLPRN